MNPEIFTEWLRRQGHRVLQTRSSYWHEISPHIFQAFPYHWTINPPEAELRSFIIEHKAIALRFSTPWDAPEGTASYHVVFERPEYLLSNLPRKVRYDVNRGLKNAHIEPISFARLASEGWQVRLETLERQGRIRAEEKGWWEKLCHSADGLHGFETWAAIIDGRLAAALVAFTCNDCCSILYQQSRTEYLRFGINNALTFAFTNEALKRAPNLWFFYGLHSLDAPPSVDEFKFRMGYTAKPVRQRAVFHPWAVPFFNQFSHGLLKSATRKWPGNPTLAKAEGMVRFFLQGQLPKDQQPLPPVLKHFGV
jgi:hypothetical protein